MKLRRVTADRSGSTLTWCEDLSDDVFVFNAVPPHAGRASSARLPCRLLRQIPCNLLYQSAARPRRSRRARAWVPSSYRCRQILEGLKRGFDLGQVQVTGDEDDPA